MRSTARTAPVQDHRRLVGAAGLAALAAIAAMLAAAPRSQAPADPAALWDSAPVR